MLVNYERVIFSSFCISWCITPNKLFFSPFFQTLVTMFKHFQNRTSLFLSREAIDQLISIFFKQSVFHSTIIANQIHIGVFCVDPKWKLVFGCYLKRVVYMYIGLILPKNSLHFRRPWLGDGTILSQGLNIGFLIL